MRGRSVRHRVGAGLAIGGVALGLALGTAVPASAGPASPASQAASRGPVKVNCGVATCSAYLSRSATKKANDKLTLGSGGYAAVAGAVCAPLMVALPAGVACAAGATVNGAWIAQEIGDAATKHGPRGACLKVTWTRPVGSVPPVITWWSTNNGKFCKD